MFCKRHIKYLLINSVTLCKWAMKERLIGRECLGYGSTNIQEITLYKKLLNFSLSCYYLSWFFFAPLDSFSPNQSLVQSNIHELEFYCFGLTQVHTYEC